MWRFQTDDAWLHDMGIVTMPKCLRPKLEGSLTIVRKNILCRLCFVLLAGWRNHESQNRTNDLRGDRDWNKYDSICIPLCIQDASLLNSAAICVPFPRWKRQKLKSHSAERKQRYRHMSLDTGSRAVAMPWNDRCLENPSILLPWREFVQVPLCRRVTFQYFSCLRPPGIHLVYLGPWNSSNQIGFI